MCDKLRESGASNINKEVSMDTSYITKKSLWSSIKGIPKEECVPPWPSPHATIYPKANIYYPLNVDTDLFNRIENIGTYSEPISPHFEPPFVRDPYSEHEAKTNYLSTEPTSFIIFSKPGSESRNLAAIIAEAWKCTVISPFVCQEIRKLSQTDGHTEQVSQNDNYLSSEMILKVIENRVNMRDVKHTGYVVEGLPLIPYEIFNDQNAVCSNETCQATLQYEQDITKQIDDIFISWPIKPRIIIYITYPDQEYKEKLDQVRTDPLTGNIDAVSDAEDEYEFNEDSALNIDKKEELTQSVLDTNIEFQRDLYERFAVPVIEKWILLHNPQNVIQIDERSSMSRMFETISVRLRILPIPRVILPKRLVNHIEPEEEDKEKTVTFDRFEGKSNEEAFEELKYIGTISRRFSWKLSPWGYLCPVELMRGHAVEGNANYAVRFINNVFFLSSQTAVRLFLGNPRPFLLPFTPRPTCRIAVFGPKYSGKSDLSKKLSSVFGGPVLNVNEIERDYCQQILKEPSTLTVDDKVDLISYNIKSIAPEEIEEGFYRDNGFVVDGMYGDINVWTQLEHLNIVFEDLIILFEEEPYQCLIEKWHKYHSQDPTENELDGEEYNEDNSVQIKLEEYLEHLQEFELRRAALNEKIATTGRTAITCDLKLVDRISEYVLDRMKQRYEPKAVIINEQQRQEERDLIEEIALENGRALDDEKDDVEKEVIEKRMVEEIRQLGDSSYYCPVALSGHNVLWKGKEEHGALFENKLYFLSSREALNEFIQNPKKYSVPFLKPLSKLPSLRISVIGPVGSGKSTVSDALSKEYGLIHVDHFYCFTKYMQDRGMPLFEPKDIFLSNIPVEEMDFPSDMNSELYNSDEATVQNFIRKYWEDGGELPKRMFRECVLKFFQLPYSEHGVVFDGFPSCAEDVSMMLENYTVPEIVIELQCDINTSLQRVVPHIFEAWQKRQIESKQKEQDRYDKEFESYTERRKAWIEELLRRRQEQKNLNTAEEDDTIDTNEFEEYEEEDYRKSLEEIWKEENPEPVLFAKWEDPETVKERISRKVQEIYERDSKKLLSIRSLMKDESIPWIEVNSEKTGTHIFVQILRILDPYMFRNISIFERTYSINMEMAEKLLECGYYFLSSFGRWCPVQLYENKNPFHMFLHMEIRQEIYPVIHRQYIYFLAGTEAHVAFLNDPLKFITQDPHIPLIFPRLSIIGPPKCGKSTLAKRFAETYGMEVVTRNAFIQQISRNTIHLRETHLRSGYIALNESEDHSVERKRIDLFCSPQGYIFDGFPSNQTETETLTSLGARPLIFLDLKADLEFCVECFSNEKKEPTNFPGSLAHRYASWQTDEASFREWLKQCNQNLVEIDASASKWKVWTQCDRNVRDTFFRIRRYFREADYEKVHRLQSMCVSPQEFLMRQSEYESFCPLCLFYENAMTTAGPSPDDELHQDEGMVQYKSHFYWICPQHIAAFVKDPERYLPPNNTVTLPKERPRVLHETVNLNHASWSERLHSNGFCLVTYVDALPTRKLVPGKSNLAVLHQDKVYLFCRSECRDKFLARHQDYAKITINFPFVLPPIEIRTLPNLAFLEQTVASLVVRAVSQVGALRPKIAGLSAAATAAIYIAIHLKVHNVNGIPEEVAIYERVKQGLANRMRIIEMATCAMKRKLNPYVKVPKYFDNDQCAEDTSTRSRVSSRTANSIRFRRTSPTQV